MIKKLHPLRLTLTLTLSLLINLPGFPQTHDIPQGYYSAADGLSGYSLKTALHNIIKNGHSGQSYGDLYDAYTEGDTDPEDGKVWDMYSENPDGADPYNFTHYQNQCGNYSSEGDCYNREHLFPQGIFNSASPMKSDYHHVVPSDGKVNGMRGSYPFGETDNPGWTSLNGSKRGPCSYPGYSGTIFEPIDEFKGDIARCMLYFATRYQDKVAGWSHTMLDGSSDQVYADWFIEMLVEWHLNDPVSSKDIMRNEAGYDFQGNRNPFIDHPEYVTTIWGGNSPAVFSGISLDPVVPTSADDVNVSATITDAEGISSVNLNWGTSSGSLGHTIAMDHSSGNVYETTSAIPAQVDGTSVYYNISVTDNESSVSTSTTKTYAIGDIAQDVVLLNEDFETTTDDTDIDLENWANIIEAGTRKWQGGDFSNNKYAKATSYQSGEENINWLITPALNLENTKEESFSFDINVGYWTHAGFRVLLSQDFDGNNVSLANWEDISSNFTIPTTPTNAYGTLSSAGTMDISSYSGTIHLAFKYNGDNSGSNLNTTTYQIDNVLIKGKEILSDNIAPKLTFSPKNNDTDIELNTSVFIVSNEALKTNTGEEIDANYLRNVIDFKLTNDQGININFTASINSSKDTITIVPQEDLAYEAVYYIAASEKAFEDAAGNETTFTSINFTTVKKADLTAPVLSFIPENGASDIELNATITIHSNEPLKTNLAAIIDEVYIKSVIVFKQEHVSGADVDYSASINNENNEIIIVPSVSFTNETVYYLALTDKAFEDTSGNETFAYETRFTTKPVDDLNSPVLTLNPQDGTMDIEPTTSIVIEANEPLFTNTGVTINEAYIKEKVALKSGSITGNNVDYSAIINNENNKITITPYSYLQYDTSYYIIVSANSFEDAAGNETIVYNSSFTVQCEPDYLAPAFTSIPVNNAIDVETNTTIVITSNEPLFTNTGTEVLNSYLTNVINLKLNNSAGVNIPFAASVNDAKTSITILAESNFAYETTYYVSLSNNAFEDASGNESNAYSIYFTTIEQADVEAPVFISGFPNTSNMTTNGFKLNVKINEVGKVFYLVQESSANAPDFQDVLEASVIHITDENLTYSADITGLTENTNYSVYLATKDDQPTPNISENLTTITETTLGFAVQITAHPENVTTCFGENISFAVTASGSGEITYSWFLNNTEIPNSNNNVLYIGNLAGSDLGNYTCKVSNSWGEDTSNEALLAVHKYVSAGSDNAINTVDTVTEIHLFGSILENPDEGGYWVDINESGALNDGVFNPSQAGAGTFVFAYVVSGDCNTDDSQIIVNIDHVNSVSHANVIEVGFYPNPTNGKLYFDLPKTESEVTLTTHTIDGKLIHSEKFNQNFKRNEVSLTGLKKGIYIVKVNSDTWYCVKQIILE